MPYFLANQTIDVGITIYGDICGLEGFCDEFLSKNMLAVLVGRNHRLWNKRPLYVEDLNGETLYYIEGTANQGVTAISQY